MLCFCSDTHNPSHTLPSANATYVSCSPYNTADTLCTVVTLAQRKLSGSSFFLQWRSADKCWTICIWSVCVLLSLSCRFSFVLSLVTWCKGHRGKDTIHSDVALPGEVDSEWLHVESNVSGAELPLRSAKSSQVDTGWNKPTLGSSWETWVRTEPPSHTNERAVGPASSDVCTWAPDTCPCAFLSFREALSSCLLSSACLKHQEQRDTDTLHAGFCLLCDMWCCVPSLLSICGAKWFSSTLQCLQKTWPTILSVCHNNYYKYVRITFITFWKSNQCKMDTIYSIFIEKHEHSLGTNACLDSVVLEWLWQFPIKHLIFLCMLSFNTCTFI